MDSNVCSNANSLLGTPTSLVDVVTLIVLGIPEQNLVLTLATSTI